eukprot:COSAG02_NODE_522_length_20749_cov_14.985278_11_plen_311_part_00
MQTGCLELRVHVFKIYNCRTWESRCQSPPVSPRSEARTNTKAAAPASPRGAGRRGGAWLLLPGRVVHRYYVPVEACLEDSVDTSRDTYNRTCTARASPTCCDRRDVRATRRRTQLTLACLQHTAAVNVFQEFTPLPSLSTLSSKPGHLRRFPRDAQLPGCRHHDGRAPGASPRPTSHQESGEPIPSTSIVAVGPAARPISLMLSRLDTTRRCADARPISTRGRRSAELTTLEGSSQRPRPIIHLMAWRLSRQFATSAMASRTVRRRCAGACVVVGPTLALGRAATATGERNCVVVAVGQRSSSAVLGWRC